MSSDPTLFDSERLNPKRAMELTRDSLLAFASHKHWVIAYSGGKDSSATVSIVCHLIITGQVPAPESLTVLYADTRMELPPLQMAAFRMFAALREKADKGEFPCRVRCEVVLPPLDERFMVYMLGRGVPPPTNTFRWCTPQIKVEPMLNALAGLREQIGEKFLMLTGVRIGESAVRDQRIALSCGRNGAECGQGWFQETTPEAIADTLAPLLHWRVCHVWDWLLNEAPRHGYPTGAIAIAYGGDQAQEANVRTGCVGCNLASRDTALERLLEQPGKPFEWLSPLTRLRPLYAELRRPKNRLRKHGEYLKDGTFSATDRLGPLTMEARLMGLAEVLGIQEAIQANAQAAGLKNAASYTLIDATEEARIRELIAANTWPQRWTGEEDRGDVLRPVRFMKGGGRQFQILFEGEPE